MLITYRKWWRRKTNKVEFLSKGAGNGVIAVYDNYDPNAADANVLWSWHIWCTEQPDIIELGLPTNGEVYSGINYRITNHMDYWNHHLK